VAVVACGCSGESASRGATAERLEPVAVAEHTASPSRGGRPRIVVLGDSLTAGLGLAAGEAFPVLLQESIDSAGLDFEVVNAGVSGDTSAGGLRRVDWALDGDVRLLVVALGGNDGLRGIPVDELRRNLAAIITKATARGVSVVLAGMEAPPNFGSAYTTAFRQVYSDLARESGVPLVPFLLDRVAGVPSLNQRDGIHPNADGAKIVAETVWTVVRPVAERHARAKQGEQRVPGS
jgi:acyl-CoA thioesterase-1